MIHIFEDEPIINRLELTTEHFELIWTKHPKFGSLEGIEIPDTIVFLKGAPIAWYRSVNESVVKRKNEHLKVEEVAKCFLKKSKTFTYSETDPVAYFIHFLPLDGSFSLAEGVQYKITYFTKSRLENFLSKELKENTFGFLQRFVPPFQSRNCTYAYRHTYSQQYLEALVSKQNYEDKKYSMYERCTGFERSLALTEIRSVKQGDIYRRCQALSESLIRHIFESSSHTIFIRSATFHYKVGVDNKIYLLFVSNIMSSKGHLIDRAQPTCSISATAEFKSNISGHPRIQFMENIESTYISQTDDVLKNQFCYNCYQNYSLNHMIRTDLKTFIDFFEGKKKTITVASNQNNPKFLQVKDSYESKAQSYDPLRDISPKYPTTFELEPDPLIEKMNKLKNSNEQNKTRPAQIPNPIKFLYPDVSFLQYAKLKNSVKISSTFVDICQICYFELSRYCPSAGDKELMARLKMYRLNNLKGTRGLCPGVSAGRLVHGLSDEVQNNQRKRIYQKEISTKSDSLTKSQDEQLPIVRKRKAPESSNSSVNNEIRSESKRKKSSHTEIPISRIIEVTRRGVDSSKRIRRDRKRTKSLKIKEDKIWIDNKPYNNDSQPLANFFGRNPGSLNPFQSFKRKDLIDRTQFASKISHSSSFQRSTQKPPSQLQSPRQFSPEKESKDNYSSHKLSEHPEKSEAEVESQPLQQQTSRPVKQPLILTSHQPKLLAQTTTHHSKKASLHHTSLATSASLRVLLGSKLSPQALKRHNLLSPNLSQLHPPSGSRQHSLSKQSFHSLGRSLGANRDIKDHKEKMMASTDRKDIIAQPKRGLEGKARQDKDRLGSVRVGYLYEAE